MKILYVSAARVPSGTANSINIVRSCSAMAKLGHEVVLLHPASHGPELEKGDPDPFSFYGVPASFRIKRLPCPGRIGGRTLYCASVALYGLAMRPDLVFGRYLRATYYLCRLGFPAVCELHSSVRFKGQKSYFLERLAASANLLAFITISRMMGDHFEQLDPIKRNRKPVLVAGCGGEPLSGEPALSKIQKVTTGLDIGYSGKLDVTKGLGLIGAIASRLPHHDFHVFGGGPEEVAEWRTRMDLRNVHFYGFIPPGDLPGYLGSLDLCLLPCQRNPVNPSGQIFGSPLKMFDYMALKKAVLASDFPEIREILDETCSVLLDPDDPAAWARTIDGLTKNDIRRLGEAAHARFISHHTREARYRRLLAEIDAIRSCRRPGS